MAEISVVNVGFLASCRIPKARRMPARVSLTRAFAVGESWPAGRVHGGDGGDPALDGSGFEPVICNRG